MASSTDTTSMFFVPPRSIRRLPVFVPSLVVQYVVSLPSTVFPGLYAVSFPRTEFAFTWAPDAAARFVWKVSLILFPNSSTRSRIALSTVPWSFGGTFSNRTELRPTVLKYIFPSSDMLLGVFFAFPQNQPDVIRASASGTVH